MPSGQIKPSIVPRLAPLPWGRQVLIAMNKRGDLATTTKNAVVKAMKEKG
ncbi:hypothetical protein [Novosphingobium colocasiae]|nr:hypothetical protein [Novosphingobium colocasiae]